MKRGYVYIMTNGPSGTLYVGVTSAIAARVAQHRDGTGSEFCKRYGLKLLVHVERYETIEAAIVREKQIKAWKRGWKLNLIGQHNPAWQDLYPTLHLD
jgi:putative endonuclease